MASVDSERLASGPASDEVTFDHASPRVRTVSVRHEFDERPRAMPPTVIIPTPAPITLEFEDALLEVRFRFYLFHKRLGPLRMMIPLLLIALMGLGFHEVFNLQRYILTVAILRFGVQLPLLILWFLGTYTQWYMYHTQAINVVIALTLGMTDISLTVIGGEPDHGPQMLYYFLVYMFLQLRVVSASTVCWSLFVGWVVCVHYLVPEFSRLVLSSSYMFVSCLALMVACYFVEYWLRVDFVRHHLLILEERKTNELLATLLPERITEQLRNLSAHIAAGTMTGEDDLIAEDHPNVSILFSDIVGFTQYSSTITAQEVVSFLSSLYTVLDYLTSEHEVLKVETIGDAYFVASGVLVPRDDHATLLANFAFAMQTTVKKFRLKGGKSLHMRIGLHSGRVIAGVVGLKVPRYHLFGESVAIATLMEQTSLPDRIQVSNRIAADLARWTDDEGRDIYELEPRVDPKEEAAELKAKRNGLETYWLTCPSAGYHEGITPAFVQPSRSRGPSYLTPSTILPQMTLTDTAPSSFREHRTTGNGHTTQEEWSQQMQQQQSNGMMRGGSSFVDGGDLDDADLVPPPLPPPTHLHVAPPRKVTLMHSNSNSNSNSNVAAAAAAYRETIDPASDEDEDIPGPPQRLGGDVRSSMSRL